MIVDRAEIIKLMRNTVKIFVPINKKLLSQEETMFWIILLPLEGLSSSS